MSTAVDLDLDRECRNCAFRKTRWICANARSDRSQKRVGSEDTCEYFEPSPAQAHFIRAHLETLLFLESQTASEKQEHSQAVISHYSQAIALGLPKEDEVAAQCGLATGYAYALSDRVLSSSDGSALSSPEMQKLLAAFQKACEDEKKYHVKYIADSWYLLARIDMLLVLNASVIAQEKSQQAAEQFTRDWLAWVEHVTPTPLPRMMLRLGKTLGRKGEYKASADCFEKVLVSLSRKEASLVPGAGETRQEALSLRQKSGSFAAESSSSRGGAGTATKTGGCFIATAVYGSEIAPEVLELRRFRDRILLQSWTGRCLVNFYYCVSPPLARLIGKNRFLKVLTQRGLLAPVLRWIERR